MEERRNERCVCGSRLRYLQEINGKLMVICVGIGCNRKWLARREGDKKLSLYKEMAREFNS